MADFILPNLNKELDEAVKVIRGGTYARIIYDNELFNAVMVVRMLMDYDCVVQFAAMQSGKSTTIALIALIMSVLYGAKGLHSIVITNLSRNSLVGQTGKALSDMNLTDRSTISIHPAALTNKEVLRLEKLVRQSPSPVLTVFLDEAHYASGKTASKNPMLVRVRRLCKLAKDCGKIVKLIPTSATPYGMMELIGNAEHPQVWGMDAAIYKAKVPKEYYGISDYWDRDHLKLKDDLSLSDEETFEELITDLQNADRLSLVRVPPKMTGHFADLFKERLPQYDIFIVGGKNLKDLKGHEPRSTEVFLAYANANMRTGKPTLGLTVDCLSMGDDIGALKPYLRVLFEPTKANVAGGSQGFGGRACGYNYNKHLVLYMERSIAEAFVDIDLCTGDVQDITKIMETYGVPMDVSTKITQKKKDHVDFDDSSTPGTYPYRGLMFTDKSDISEVPERMRDTFNCLKDDRQLPERAKDKLIVMRSTHSKPSVGYTNGVLNGSIPFTKVVRGNLSGTYESVHENVREGLKYVGYVFHATMENKQGRVLGQDVFKNTVCPAFGIDADKFLFIVAERTSDELIPYPDTSKEMKYLNESIYGK